MCDPSGILKARWIYLRVLGFCFFATFVSLLLQIPGLIGPRGIFPASEILAQTSFFKAPSLFWLGTSTAWIVIVCVLGLCGALLVIVDRWNRVALALCWVCFLSLASVSPQFTWYRADSLLLESAFLAWFLASRGPPSRISLFAHLWLLFRLMLETGLAKAFSNDPVWKDLDAMAYFHQNMPFPTWVGWFFSKFPYGVHRFETALTLVAECFTPFLLFCWRRARFVALVLWFCLQVGIILSGNFVSFNYLSIGLGLLFVGYSLSDAGGSRRKEFLHGLVLAPQMFIGLVLLLSFPVFPALPVPGPIAEVLEAVAPFRSVNQYILYPTIGRERRVVVLQGSDDNGATWREYGYRWQTQRLDRRPKFLSPLSDRFEREMMRVVERSEGLSYRRNAFVLNVATRLLEGVPEVGRLFEEDPFEGRTPQRIRAVVYRFETTDLGRLLTTGHWWTRRKVGLYCPEIVRNPEDGRIGYVDSP